MNPKIRYAYVFVPVLVKINDKTVIEVCAPSMEDCQMSKNSWGEFEHNEYLDPWETLNERMRNM